MARARDASADVPALDAPGEAPVVVAPLGSDPVAEPATAVLFNASWSHTWAPLTRGLVRLAPRETLTVLLDEVTDFTKAAAQAGDFLLTLP